MIKVFELPYPNITNLAIFILCLAMAIFFLKNNKKKKKTEKYIMLFKNSFERTKDIRLTMLEIKSSYKENSKESKALSIGINYLEHSIFKDYKTALSFIEKVLNNSEVNKMHKNTIEKIKRLRIIMLEDKKEA